MAYQKISNVNDNYRETGTKKTENKEMSGLRTLLLVIMLTTSGLKTLKKGKYWQKELFKHYSFKCYIKETDLVSEKQTV